MLCHEFLFHSIRCKVMNVKSKLFKEWSLKYDSLLIGLQMPITTYVLTRYPWPVWTVPTRLPLSHNQPPKKTALIVQNPEISLLKEHIHY